jgi:hypothetical protein
MVNKCLGKYESLLGGSSKAAIAGLHLRKSNLARLLVRAGGRIEAT